MRETHLTPEPQDRGTVLFLTEPCCGPISTRVSMALEGKLRGQAAWYEYVFLIPFFFRDSPVSTLPFLWRTVRQAPTCSHRGFGPRWWGAAFIDMCSRRAGVHACGGVFSGLSPRRACLHPRSRCRGKVGTSSATLCAKPTASRPSMHRIHDLFPTSTRHGRDLEARHRRKDDIASAVRSPARARGLCYLLWPSRRGLREASCSSRDFDLALTLASSRPFHAFDGNFVLSTTSIFPICTSAAPLFRAVGCAA